MKCKLCESSEDFGKSHIIPKSFFLHSEPKNEAPVMLTNESGQHPKLRPVGEYDDRILCKECEKKFADWDNYSKLLLLDEAESFEVIKEGSKIISFSKEEFNYEKLKLFCLSVLWRAGVSKRGLFRRVKLGPHETALKEMILARDPGEKEKYSVRLFRLLERPYDIPIIDPIRARDRYGYWFYRVYLGQFFYDVTVDSRKIPAQHSAGIIQAGQPLLACARDIMRMSEAQILKKILDAPQNVI